MAGPGLNPALSQERLEFVGELYEAGERAAEAAGGFEERSYSIADTTIRMRFAGSGLVGPVATTFKHLEAELTDEPDLTALMWDSESTGVEAPSPPWALEDYGTQGRIEGLFGDGVYASFTRWSGSLSVLEIDFFERLDGIFDRELRVEIAAGNSNGVLQARAKNCRHSYFDAILFDEFPAQRAAEADEVCESDVRARKGDDVGICWVGNLRDEKVGIQSNFFRAECQRRVIHVFQCGTQHFEFDDALTSAAL